MRKQAKKGFTIVELVIVIALIAILAAVLIPTFSNVINNAHESSDTMMVKNLNTILNAEEVNGNRAENMTEALKQAEEGGYKVDKLTPTSSGDIVWDQASNRFVLINAKKEVVYKDESVTEIASGDLAEAKAYRFWKITNDATKETKGYSLYLADGYKGSKTINAATGIDVGTNEDVTVTYTNKDSAKEVLLRTNGGTLTVDAANDTVSHYGAADKVVITAVAGNSYHEFGEVVGNIEIANGRVVMETGSAASAIKVTATKENVESGAAKIAVDTKTSAVAVVVPADVKTAIEAKGGNITAAEDKIVTDTTVIENMDKFAGGLGTAESPYLIATYDQLLNIKNSNKAYYKLISDIVIAADANVAMGGDKCVVASFYGSLDGNGYSITNNYEVHGSGVWFALFDKVYGSVEIKNLTLNYGKTWFNLVSNLYGNLTVENVVLEGNGNTINVAEAGNNYGLLVSKCLINTSGKDVVFKNIKNYVNIEAENSVIGVWVGIANPNNNYTYDNVSNYGNINAGSISYFFGNVGNAGFIDPMKDMITNNKLPNIKVINSYNYGAIYGTNNCALLSYSTGKDYLTATEAELMKNINKEAGAIIKIASSGAIVINKNDDGTLTVTKNTAAAKHVISYSTYWHYENGDHALFTVTFEITDSQKVNYYAHFADIKDGNTDGYNLLENEPRTCANGMQFFVAEKDGQVYYLFNNVSDYIYSTVGSVPTFNATQYPTIKVLAYDNSGKLIDYTIFNK